MRIFTHPPWPRTTKIFVLILLFYAAIVIMLSFGLALARSLRVCICVFALQLSALITIAFDCHVKRVKGCVLFQNGENEILNAKFPSEMNAVKSSIHIVSCIPMEWAHQSPLERISNDRITDTFLRAKLMIVVEWNV